MKKGFKKVKSCFVVPHEFNLATICNIRNDISMNRNDSSYISSNQYDYNLDFISELQEEGNLYYINLSCEKQDELIEIDKTDVENFIIQDSTLYFKKEV